MSKSVYGITGSIFLVGALLFFGAPNEATAVMVNVNIGPPPIVVAEPPEVVMVPGSQVYFVPGVDFNVFFYNGFWWSPRGDRWYRSRAYNGPWGIINRRFVPGPLFHVPHDYRRAYARERHIPYGEWRGHHERAVHREMREERHERAVHREMREERHERREDFRERGGRREGEGHGGHGHDY